MGNYRLVGWWVPPSRITLVPVKYPARSEAKNATKSPTSSGLAIRRIGISATISFINSSTVRPCSSARVSSIEVKNSVCTGPESRLLTVMLKGASSLASILE